MLKINDEIKLPSLLAGASTPAEWEGRRKEIKNLLTTLEYGTELPAPTAVEFIEEHREANYCASKATLMMGKIHVEVNGGSFEFPFSMAAPNDGAKHPAIVCLNFRRNFPDRYLPVEELIDRGFVVSSFDYNDVSPDKNDFSDPLPVLLGIDRTKKTAPGKIMFWAWAAMRAADCLLKTDFVDPERLVVGGHSRLGKTALVTGAFDDRFKIVYSNDSGCGGAAISRKTGGETVAKITEVFPYWFCPGFADYAGREEELPFDQHFLLALSAPRKVYVASAEKDAWACPENELLSCIAASPAWELYGLDGVEKAGVEVGTSLHAGNVGYHLRAGTHYMGREDWGRLADFVERQFR